ncbi:hypothetical protein AGABI2DRAFT_122727 [Agaricus bisporus var. bisporus H97]|uniref:hypothetical protein n=1 Tax=Agaricus bisporus var. bisporus (strain H97 / ATCC MYA-4626 / FGSC 10389) TaxID=936046 RepID=UPI00029F7DA3|nr:hypothetical protein AGABI2DRAFT_122727 [Agaricus bisporus var. bisporus H97]EKV42502.1 hypothetical protein AGABI2DRAFT_122727 [Agaricus bisporus var. bisporus H97]
MALYQYPSIALTLPSEVLTTICRIFLQTTNTLTQCCRQDIIDHDAETFQSIMSVSQVCRGWRDIVTRCPELWCHFINPYHSVPDWTKLLLERSKPRGITLYNPLPNFMEHEDEPDFFEEIAYANRLSSYSVALDMDCRIWGDPRVPLYWPQLRYLCIAHIQYYEEEPTFDPGLYEHVFMPTDFPSFKSTPKLERLHLHSCALWSVSQITGLSQLKELRISGNRVWSVPQWVEILQSLRHLKRLSLDNAIVEPIPTGVLGLQNNWKSDHILTMELEEFFLRDDFCICAQFFEHITFTTSRIFQLVCHNAEGTYDAESYSLSIGHCITPIIHNFLITNLRFSNCVLHIASGTVGCLGLPDDALDKFEWPNRAEAGGSFFDGTHVEVDFDLQLEHQNQYAKMVQEWLHPIFSNVIHLDIHDNEDAMFQDDHWFSELLWKSSFRLRAIHGISCDAWYIILQNMFSGLYAFKPPRLPAISFLYALEEIGMFINHIPEGYPLYQTIFEFCNRKSMMGTPLIKFHDPPPLREAKFDLDRAAFMTQLEALGVQVNDDFGRLSDMVVEC